jgi:phasin family protein
MVTKQQETFSEIQQKNLEAAMRLAQLSIESSQRIMGLQVETAKALFEDGVESAKALATVHDPKASLELRTEYARATTEKMLSAARSIAEIATQTQTEFGKVVGSQLMAGSQEMAEAVQKMFSFNPAAGQAVQTAMSSLQQAVDMARGAFDQIAKASTEAIDSFGHAATASGRGGKSK